MKIGTVKEIKKHEYRVGLTPNCAASYIQHGHQAYVESGSGVGAGFSDEEYKMAGAIILPDAESIYQICDMIVKVKEPLPEEFPLLKEGLILFTYLHLAANETLTKALLEAKVKGVAYETITDKSGNLPCLRPISEIAGRMSVQEGAKYLENSFGGRGVLLGGVPGVERGKVLVFGGGVVGANACKMAVGLGALVTVMDVNLQRLTYLDDIFGGTVTTLYSNQVNLEVCLSEADLVIGAVLIPGTRAPWIIRREHLRMMKKGAVIVDVAVDQGGCCETTRATHHDDPVYIEEEVIHYCVANIPGAVARTSTQALTNITLKYGLDIADNGLEEACRQNQGLASGINVYYDKCSHAAIANTFNLNYTPLADVLWE